MKKMKIQTATLLGTLFAWNDRLTAPRGSVALANTLTTIEEHGVESLFVDPTSGNLPFANRFLVVQRGVSGYQYGDVCAGGPGGSYPLGVCADSPFAVGDVLNVRRFSARPGLEIGIGAAGKTVTIDKLLVSAAAGTVQDITTITAAGTYWVVGRSASSLTTTGSTQEVTFVPCEPYQIVYSGSAWSFPTVPA
jgi:hypothetical protein